MLISVPEFPNSYTTTPFQLTSPPTPHYNCIAWAFGDDSKWYWPDGIYFWPPDISRSLELESFIELYALIGYDVCDHGEFEEGIEKIAIFADVDGPTHAARQLNNGMWTSKLGNSNDIEHTIEAMNGGVYGDACIFMARPFQ